MNDINNPVQTSRPVIDLARPTTAGPLVLPPIPNPYRYAGLFLYDFGDHVSVGYTAAEIHVLRTSPIHAGGTAYEIYRVGERGAMELRGVRDDRLARAQSMHFLRRDPADARRDYDALRQAARREPLTCAVTMQLVAVNDSDPPHVTMLTFPSACESAVAGWLSRRAPDLGDEVRMGPKEHLSAAAPPARPIAACALPLRSDLTDRTPAEVLATVDRSLQR